MACYPEAESAYWLFLKEAILGVRGQQDSHRSCSYSKSMNSAERYLIRGRFCYNLLREALGRASQGGQSNTHYDICPNDWLLEKKIQILKSSDYLMTCSLKWYRLNLKLWIDTRTLHQCYYSSMTHCWLFLLCLWREEQLHGVTVQLFCQLRGIFFPYCC